MFVFSSASVPRSLRSDLYSLYAFWCQPKPCWSCRRWQAQARLPRWELPSLLTSLPKAAVISRNCPGCYLPAACVALPNTANWIAIMFALPNAVGWRGEDDPGEAEDRGVGGSWLPSHPLGVPLLRGRAAAHKALRKPWSGVQVCTRGHAVSDHPRDCSPATSTRRPLRGRTRRAPDQGTSPLGLFPGGNLGAKSAPAAGMLALPRGIQEKRYLGALTITLFLSRCRGALVSCFCL